MLFQHLTSPWKVLRLIGGKGASGVLITSAEFRVCGRERMVNSPRAGPSCRLVGASTSAAGHVGWIRRRLRL